jgi:hypothetical protein
VCALLPEVAGVNTAALVRGYSREVQCMPFAISDPLLFVCVCVCVYLYEIDRGADRRICCL